MINLVRKYTPKGIKKSIKIYLHRGNKYICPFCGYKSNNLAPIGMNNQVYKEPFVVGAGLRNGGCYKCESTDREKLIFIFLKEKLNLFDGNKKMNILHIAPEKNLTHALLRVGFENYICGDLFMDGYQYQQHVRNMNILDLPFENNYFDFIICNHVLEHIINDRDALAELYRTLKHGGKSIIQVPIYKDIDLTFEDQTITEPAKRELVFGQFDHVRIYGQDYIERLKSVGFKVERINISEQYLMYGLNQYEDIFLCEK